MILPKDFDWRYFATPKSQIFTWRMLFCWLALCLHTTTWSVVSFDEFESVMSHSSDLIWLNHKSNMHLTMHIQLRQSVHLYIKYLANKAIKGRWISFFSFNEVLMRTFLVVLLTSYYLVGCQGAVTPPPPSTQPLIQDTPSGWVG